MTRRDIKIWTFIPGCIFRYFQCGIWCGCGYGCKSESIRYVMYTDADSFGGFYLSDAGRHAGDVCREEGHGKDGNHLYSDFFFCVTEVAESADGV